MHSLMKKSKCHPNCSRSGSQSLTLRSLLSWYAYCLITPLLIQLMAPVLVSRLWTSLLSLFQSILNFCAYVFSCHLLSSKTTKSCLALQTERDFRIRKIHLVIVSRLILFVLTTWIVKINMVSHLRSDQDGCQ